MTSSRWAIAIVAGLALIPAAIALGASRRKRQLGTVDEDEDEYEAEKRKMYHSPLPKDQGDCLVLGKDHPFYPFGKYEVCLTENQKHVLFKGKKGKKIGCGVFACAYGTSSRTKVVKFTRDSEDVAALLQAQPLGVVPKVYATYKLKAEGKSINTGEEAPVYALVVERLKPFSPAEREALDEDMFRVGDVVGGYEDLNELCESTGEVVCETAKAAIKLKQAGIKWSDIHSGNIGLDKTGHVKVLDLGITGTQLKEQPKLLEGAMRRLAKRGIRDV